MKNYVEHKPGLVRKVRPDDYPVLQVTLKLNGRYNLDLLTPNRRWRLETDIDERQALLTSDEFLALEIITRKGNEP